MKIPLPAIGTGVELLSALIGVVVLAMIVSGLIAHCSPAPSATAKQHDAAIAEAVAHRDSAKMISDSIDRTVVRPAYAKDSSARKELRRVLAADTLVPLDVDSLKAALTVTSAAAVQLDSSSGKLIGGLVALVAAKTAEASASDTVASRATSALSDERKNRNHERWIYRAKIAGGVLLGVALGVVIGTIER